ncbi:hypothetical protein OUZ56_028550 [Daphnia magna]|uniref:Uncharacterized protein n=1 Tax=Daphnia magna TaxID=35525 RepID=A0ABR0B483_9CRUS|nr:hypothetical protein OUZ56_028550 [Daphnia magna]
MPTSAYYFELDARTEKDKVFGSDQSGSTLWCSAIWICWLCDNLWRLQQHFSLWMGLEAMDTGIFHSVTGACVCV